jgi:hypothetical protein
MSEDRRQILNMLAEGKITAEEADRLLSALASRAAPAAFAPVMTAERPNRPRYLRVVVEANDHAEGGPATVNVRVPMQLLRAGVKLSALLPPRARDEVNRALARQGIPFDINQLKPENLEDLVDQLGELSVDVASGEAKVRVFCE